MPENIEKKQVQKVAKLSRLQLTDGEIKEFTGQLSAILKYFEKLQQLDTESVKPLAHCLPVNNVFRDDLPEQSLGTEKTLENAPRRDGDFFKVPKILDENSGA